eukprot:97239-Pyramimonas_sp.AAC.1
MCRVPPQPPRALFRGPMCGLDAGVPYIKPSRHSRIRSFRRFSQVAQRSEGPNIDRLGNVVRELQALISASAVVGPPTRPLSPY